MVEQAGHMELKEDIEENVWGRLLLDKLRETKACF